MPAGGGPRRRGSAGLWWKLAALAAAGLATALAKITGAPGWLMVPAAVVGAVVVGGAGLITSHILDRAKARADIERRTGEPAMWRVHHATRDDVAYIRRDVQGEVEKRLRVERRVLVVGASMTGKTRLALSAAKQSLPDYTEWVPYDAKSLHDLLAEGPAISFDKTVVLLDDVERFAAGGLTPAHLSKLLEQDSVSVIATVRTSELDKMQSSDETKPTGWNLVGWFGDPILLKGWSKAELGRLQDQVDDPALLLNAQRYGLSQFLGGAPLMETKMTIGETEHPDNFAVVQIAADWRRVGLTNLKLEDLASLFTAYRPERHTVSAEDQAKRGVEWAREPISQSIALLLDEPSGYRTHDLVQDYFDAHCKPIPARVWDLALQRADGPEERFRIATRAHEANLTEVARTAFQEDADAGYPHGMFGLGVLANEADPMDLDRAQHWYTLAATAGLPFAMHDLGVLLDRESDPPDVDGACYWYGRAAEAGVPASMNNLGQLLAKLGGETNLALARSWLEKAVEAGYTGALLNLGNLFADRFDPPDMQAARKWYTAGALSGDVNAMFNLGSVMADAQDPLARHWYTMAALEGHLGAMNNLGALLVAGRNKADLDEACHWFEKAADAGHVNAMFSVGHLMANLIDPPDLVGARRWWEKASETGDTRAMVQLASLLEDRMDPPEHDLAIRWWWCAAEAGHPDAMFIVGLLAIGSESPDLDEARRWLAKATAAGHREARAALAAL